MSENFVMVLRLRQKCSAISGQSHRKFHTKEQHKVNVCTCIWPVSGLCYWLYMCTVVGIPTSLHKVASEMSIEE